MSTHDPLDDQLDDQPDDQPDQLDRPLDDPREEQVRRLLTDARHADPVPVDVAARLDRVLARLADGAGDQPLPDLAARRRRHAAGLLAAAAAVAVVGVGLGQVLPSTGGIGREGGSASTTTADEGQAFSVEGGDAAGGAAEQSTGGQAQPPAPQDGALDLSRVADPVRVRADRFAADALRARDRIDSRPGASSSAGSSGRPGAGASGRSQPFFACEPAEWGNGVVVPVLYDGRPHVLAFRAPAGDSQVVDLLECGTGDILRSTTLPAG